MQKILAAGLLLCTCAGWAEVLSVDIWKPMPGKGPLTIQYGQEARAIYEKLGGRASVGVDTMGRMHFIATFDSWTAWAEVGGKLQASQEWAAFDARINAAPSAQLETQYMLNPVSPGAPGAVFQVFIWQPELGRGSDMVERGLRAEKIHEKAGADVSINVDQLGRMHYVTSFESAAAWGKFADTPNEAFAKFMQDQSKDPTGRLVQVHTIYML